MGGQEAWKEYLVLIRGDKMNDIQTLENIFEGFTLNTNLLTYALLIGIVSDFATGIFKGYKADGEIISQKLRDGGFKKAGIVFVVIMAYGLSMLFGDTSHIIFNSVQAYYVYTELVSILENLAAVGVPLPKVLRNILGNKKDGGENGD